MNQNIGIFIYKIAFKYAICKMVVILSEPQ